jgi:hypothetical protein
MSSVYRRAALATAALLAMASAAAAQNRPYIGYVYPAGGQQGTTFRIKIGGQNMDGVNGAVVTGEGATGKVLEVFRKLGPQEITLLNEQLEVFRKRVPERAWAKLTEATQGSDAMMSSEIGMASKDMMSEMSSGEQRPAIHVENLGISPKIVNVVTHIRSQMSEYVLRPESAAISSLVIAEITIAPGAAPGKRELRINSPRGVSNPMVFYVGQLPEASRAPMLVSELQVLGKEALALRRQRSSDTAERRITIPCTVNGQVANGEVHHYRFSARKGQRLVFSTSARELVPFIADAVPGWFQPVLALYDAKGKEVAYDDDYYFDPDPLILFEVPKDGEYVMKINDAIYRGREDFVYRVTIDETPMVTSIFPLGAQAGTSPSIAMKGWNLDGARLNLPAEGAKPGVHFLRATKGDRQSNRIPFALDTLPECLEKEPNNDVEHAQKVEIPVIINGRIDRPDDWDVFQFYGHGGQTIVTEVMARRLNSPLDSVLRITDAQGALVGINDDHDDPEAGTRTHYADSYLMVTLPHDGTYYVHLGDVARNGGEEYAYRLRISEPRPDFALRVAPSSVFLRKGNSSAVSIYIYRKDGFAGPIKVFLKDPPEGILASTAFIAGKEPVAKLNIKAGFDINPGLFNLVIQGSAISGADEIVRDAVPAEDRMQAFLWRHLVPAQELKAFVYDPAADKRRSKRNYTPGATIPIDRSTGKPKFDKKQVAGRLRQLELLFEDGLLTPEFYREKVAECGGAE